MAALAEIFASKGALLSGSDVPDSFYTDAVLASIGMKPHQSFDAGHIGEDIDLVVYSDAYSAATNPEMAEAAKRGLPMFSFAQALGALSAASDASGVAGVHGKTTTTAMTGSILAALRCPATVLAGSAVSSFGDRCTMIRGQRYFVAETDEYKRHFMYFSPRRILLTSIESDHQDFYPTYESIFRAFCDYILRLPPNGLLIYCADDPGAAAAADFARGARSDLRFAPYGFTAEGPWKIETCETGEGKTEFRVKASGTTFELRVPGRHLVLDAVGALALAGDISGDYGEVEGDRGGYRALSGAQWQGARESLAKFAGSRRRSEVIGEAAGVLFMDDYAHHPTALRTTIEGIKAFWPSRRLVVDFMSHTYSRTIALMDEFAASLDPADCLVLHGIYSSAREKPVEGVSGRDLFEKARARRPELVDFSGDLGSGAGRRIGGEGGFILYEETPQDAAAKLLSLLRKGDLFITMGAGDNWKLGRILIERLVEKERRDV